MKINKIQWRNIMCYGNKLHTIDYNNIGNGSLNTIIGKNGCGKSTFIKLHKLALYFEADGLTNDSIANDINGDGYIAINVTSNGHVYDIISEYTKTKLNKLTVLKDNQEQDWGKIPDTKKMIAQEIIDVPYHIFSNILSLSINDFKSFLSMTPKDTRNIRDRIFGFYVLNNITETIKSNIKVHNDSATSYKIAIDSNAELLKDVSAQLQSYKDRCDENAITKRSIYLNRISMIDSIKQSIDDKIKSVHDDISYYELVLQHYNNVDNEKILSEHKKNLELLLSQKSAKELSRNTNSDNILLYQSDQALMQRKRDYETYKSSLLEIEDLQKSKSELELKSKSLKAEKASLMSYIDTVNKDISYNSALGSLIELLANVRSAKSIIQSNQQSLELLSEQIDQYNSIILQAKSDIKSNDDEIKDLQSSVDLYRSGKCPTCGNDFNNDNYSRIINESEQRIEFLRSVNDTKTTIIAEAQQSINGIDTNALQSIIDTNNNAIIKYNSIIERDYKIFIDKIVDDNIDLPTRAIDHEELKLSVEQFNKISADIHHTDTIIAEINGTINNISSKITVVEAVNESYKIITDDDTVESITESIKAIGDVIKSINNDINDIESTISTVRSSINAIKIVEVGDIKIISKEEAESLLQSCHNDIEALNSKSSKALMLQYTINAMLQSINTADSNVIKNYNDSIDKYKKLIDDNNTNYEKCLKNIKFLKVAMAIISDEGVKSYIIKKLVPFINNSVNAILSKLEIPITVKFDDEFKPEIYRFGQVVSLRSISTGQTKLIDSAIIVTITKMLIGKYPNINVVFYDEIFSSLHQTAITTMMEIIHKELVQDLGLHVFLVNHSYISSAFFDNVLELTYKDHYSNLNQYTTEQYNLLQNSING